MLPPHRPALLPIPRAVRPLQPDTRRTLRRDLPSSRHAHGLGRRALRCAKAVYTSRRSPFSAPTNTPTSSPPARCATKPRLSSPTSPLAFARSSSGSRWAMLSRTAFKSRALAATAAPPPSRAANITKRKRTLRRFVVIVRTKVAPEPACARCAIADRDRQKSPPTPAQHARSHRR